MDKINVNSLILFDDIRNNAIVDKAVSVYNRYADGKEMLSAAEAYYDAQRQLLAVSKELESGGTYWQNYMCRLIAASENRFSLMAERGETDSSIRLLAQREIRELKKLYSIDWDEVGAAFDDGGISVFSMKLAQSPMNFQGKREAVKAVFLLEEDEKSAEKLYDYYKKSGCGIFEEYEAFIWDGGLVGVKNYDRITFDQLVGYEMQKEQLLENTKYFLRGYRANNVLLYGDRGTGKSSGVKALLNEFKDQKLKIISLNKNNVKDLYRIIEAAAGRGCKFILFIDDLSFEETELEYKYFKSVIEGGIEAQPDNILIYVTSNRRNIIRETWKDRSRETGDVHNNDGIQERMSLADRFGLLITYTSPDKAAYLEIVRQLARQEQLVVEEEELIAQALMWELRHNGRSGRTAKQFIYHMKAKSLKV